MVIVLAVGGAVITLFVLFLLENRLPKKPNYKNKPIPTAAGVTLVPAALTGLLIPGGVFYPLYLLLCAGVGFADDLWGGSGERGFRGHVGAFLGGRISTGFVKVAALGGGALVVGFAEFGIGWVGLAGGVLLAGCVNLANLLDVRPGRAIKLTGPFIVALAFASAAALQASAEIGGLAGLFYFDLRGRIMLGDAGAAVLGGVLGVLLLSLGPGAAWVAGGVVVAGLTGVAEVSSISELIGRVGLLRAYDLWGRDRLD